MEVKDVQQWQFGGQWQAHRAVSACVLAVGLAGLSGWLRAAEPELVPASPATPAAAASASGPSTPAAAPSSNPFSHLRQEELLSTPGSFDRQLKLNRQPSDDAGFSPAPQPALTLRDMMRMRDQMEEKKNWMFLDSGSLTEKKTYDKEDEFWKDRFDKKEDLRKKGWWEYQKDKTAVGMIMGKRAPKDGLERKELEAEFQAKIFGKGQDGDSSDHDEDSSRERSERSRSGSLLFGGNSREGRDGTHLNSDLDVKNVYSTDLLPEKDVKGAFGLKELLGTDGRSMEERNAAAGRREDFRNFLNTSRVPAAQQSRTVEPPVPNPLNLQPPTFEVNGAKVTPSEFFSSSTAASPQRLGNGSSFDAPAGNRSSLNSAPMPTYRVSPAAAPSYITPDMMKAPKRRF